MAFFIGIDIGTTISKGVIISDNGTVKNEFQIEHSYSSEVDYALVWWNETVQIIQQLMKGIEANEVKSITISAMVPNLVFLDNEGNITVETVLYTDDFAISIQNELDHDDGTKWKNETLSKLIALKRSGIDLDKVETLLSTHNYIGYRMCGRRCCDYSSAFEYGHLFNEQGLCWDKNIMQKHDINISWFPKLVPSTAIIGKILPEIAERIGVSSNVDIIAGTHDSIASMIGAGLIESGDQLVYYGTFNCSAIILSDVVDILEGNVIKSPVVWTASIPDSGPQFTSMCKLLCGTVDYNMFDKQASASSPGANGVVFIQNPELLNTSISSLAKGMFYNISNDSSLPDLCRAVYEAFPYGVKAFWDEYFPPITPTYRFYAAGGGSRSKVRMQIFSDALCINQIKIHNAENAYGTALIGIAAYSTDCFKTIQRKRLKDAEYYNYNSESKERYLKALDQYLCVLKKHQSKIYD